MYTIDELNAMTDAQKAVVKKQAVRNVAIFVAIKIGAAVAVHYGVKAIVKKLDSRESAETPNQ
jgi:hypothetical protein